MKKLITNYSFDASAKEVTLTGITVNIESVIAIWNQTDGALLYYPATPGYGGTAAGSVITLTFDSSTMSDTDKLVIYYDDGELPSSAAKQDAQSTLLGAVNETAPSTDTASSGVNGRLQRIAQNLTSFFGAKTTSVTALETGGSGVIGWLSQIWRDIKGGIVLQAGTNAIGTVEVTKQPKSSSANTPSVGTSAGDVISSNSSRKSWGIQNLGTNTLYVRMATGATTSVFHFALAPGATNDDGYGASISDDTYTGVVSVAGTSPRYTSYEL